MYDINYRKLNNLDNSLPTFGETIRGDCEQPRILQPPSPERDEKSHYDFNRNSFIFESLNRNLELYKLIHNELVNQNSRIDEQLSIIELLNNNVKDIIENMIEVNVVLNEIKKNTEGTKEKEKSKERRQSTIETPRSGRPILGKVNSFKK